LIAKKVVTIATNRQSLIKGQGPLYQRLADVLASEIETGKHRTGDLFPGDMQLASEYGVSVITVRAAMRILIDRGLVARYPGKGSFVLRRQQLGAQWGLGSIDDLVNTGLQARLVLLRKELIVPPAWVSERYTLSPGNKLYWFRTVRVNQGERFLLNDIYHLPHIGAKINKLKFNNETSKKLVITLVEEQCGVTLKEVKQSMSAELASSDVAKTLGIKRGQPVLSIDRDYFSTDGELIQVARTRYRLDHYRYTINMSRLDNKSALEHTDLIVSRFSKVAV